MASRLGARGVRFRLRVWLAGIKCSRSWQKLGPREVCLFQGPVWGFKEPRPARAPLMSLWFPMVRVTSIRVYGLTA